MSTNQEARRRAPRIGLRSEMRYRIRGVTSEFSSTLSDNISTGGVAFNASSYIAPQTPLMLEIDVLSRVLHPIGRVAWCDPLPCSERNKLGVEFLEMDHLEKNYLADYINMQRARF